jgi:4-aminobutyrate aminotransferase / (S)-3-amino-2-methylpropionate transaminase / 5-aminovalerate transaminase
MKTIHIKTMIPGPESQKILNRRTAATPVGLAKSTNIVVKSAKGAVVEDVDGNILLDFAGGIGMLNAGHRPDAVVNAIKEQLDQFIHSCALVTTFEPYVELAEKLNTLTPGDFPKKTLLSCSGSEAVENAIKVSRAYTGRQAIITFEGAYHGRTLLTLGMTSKYALFKKSFGPFPAEIYRLPAPNLYRKPSAMSDAAYIDHCILQLNNALIAQVDPTAVAAIVIEPMQGEAGFIPIPAPFLQRIREICDQYGIVMVADEIQSGFGRTGKWFAIEHSAVVPDLITMAKSLGSGVPISALTGKAEIMDAPHLGGVGGTYGGSPIAAVAAIKTIETFEKENLLEKSVVMGEEIRKRLESFKEKFQSVGDVRGLGSMRLIEFVSDPVKKTPDPDKTLAIIREAVSKGLVLIRAGLYSNCIRLLPPLVTTKAQIHEGLDILESCIAMHD